MNNMFVFFEYFNQNKIEFRCEYCGKVWLRYPESSSTLEERCTCFSPIKWPCQDHTEKLVKKIRVNIID